VKNKFGEFIKTNRKLKMMSLRETAEKLGISPAYLCDIEKGQRNPSGFYLLLKFQEVLGLSQSELEHACDLIAEEQKVIPPDILEGLYCLSEKHQREFWWKEIRSSLKG
jgi:transcriptional regulator with XRE-family HTH domain